MDETEAPVLFPNGSIALVTGASRGIGRAAALDLAREGARVAVGFTHGEERAKEVVSEIEAAGGEAIAVRADVTDEKQVREMFRRVRSEFGGLDVLVANAGISDDKHVAAMRLDQWQRVIDTNVTGTFLCCREAMRTMQYQRHGSIVALSSTTSIDGGFGGTANYTASKGAIISFAKTLAREASPYNVRVNVVAPGFVATDMTDKVPAAIRAKYASAIRLRRMADPAEIAYLVSFLASSKASYVTSSVFVADGGGTE